ncbi:MAG: aminoglycoside 6-adenylyltransferase [Thermoanaerobaculia bacterium]
MDSEEYQRFTDRLREGLAADERVLGLVVLGSMARQDTRPDRWSDHDFFVIVRRGEQEAFRQDLSWLPDSGDLVLSYRETAHGLKALYRDGYLLEFAVFDSEELHLAKVNRYRVLLDRGGVAEAMARIREESARWVATSGMGDFERFGQFLANLLVGVGRHARGEHLSGRQFLGYALQNLVVLLAKHVPKEADHPLDDLDPLRRFERVWPVLGRELEEALQAPVPEGARRMLDIARRELEGRLPGYPAEALGVVRARIKTVST